MSQSLAFLPRFSGWCLLISATCAAVSGCAAVEAHSRAGEYVKAGGVGDQQKSAAQVDLQRARTDNLLLQEEKVRRERELQDTENRLRTMETEVARQEKLLADAVGARQLTQQRSAELKRELDAIRSEIRQLDLQNKSAAIGKPDPVADKAKQERLRALEARKRALEASLAQLTSVKR